MVSTPYLKHCSAVASKLCHSSQEALRKKAPSMFRLSSLLTYMMYCLSVNLRLAHFLLESQSCVTQSLALRQALPLSHLAGQEPPQSISVSSPFFTPSSHGLNEKAFDLPRNGIAAKVLLPSWIHRETVVFTTDWLFWVQIGIAQVKRLDDAGLTAWGESSINTGPDAGV